MAKLRLSIDSFAERLADHVAFTDYRSVRPASIERAEIWDPKTYLLNNDCIYLHVNGDFPPCNRIQQGTSIITCDLEHRCADEDCRRCNVIAVEGLSSTEIVNKTLALLARTSREGRAIELAADAPEPRLQEMLDLSEQLLGMPLCVLDINLDVVAKSNEKELFAHPLWETIIRQNKPARCEILDALAMTHVGEDEAARQDSVDVAEVSGFFTLSRRLLKKGRPVGSIWAFSKKAGCVPNHRDQCLFEWVAGEFNEWAMKTDELHFGRGMKTERFLLDLIDGTFVDEAHASSAAAKVGYQLKDKPEHMLLYARSVNSTLRTDTDLTLAEAIEASIPGSICTISGEDIITLIGTDASSYLPKAQQEKLDKLFCRLGYLGILGTPYKHAVDTPLVAQRISTILSFIDLEKEGAGLKHFYDYLVQNSMRIVLGAQPPETLLHPLVRKLVAYDHDNHTDYLETFKIYLNNRCNVTDTAEQLHMHRNTLLHRVKRIEEIAGCTFEDWTLRRLLLFSIDYLYLDDDRPI